jgi:uncharacterized protein
MIRHIRLEEIRLDFTQDETLLKNKIKKILLLDDSKDFSYEIVKKSLDSRDKRNILFIYCVDVIIEEAYINLTTQSSIKHRARFFEPFRYDISRIATSKDIKRPVIIWSWPGWLFAWLALSKAWLRPIIIERWKDVDSRIKDVDDFIATRILDTESNIQFWEWWAWTFSDWKLYTLINDPRSKYVFDELIEAWAPKEIAYSAKAHVWTDILRVLIKNIRNKIISNWWEVIFQTKFTDFEALDWKLKSITLNDSQKFETDFLVLAIGHSARDTYEMLYEKWLLMKQKPFAIWLRIEHDAKMIDNSQFWEQNCGSPKLWTASYKLVSHSPEARSVYTFCMCPGWYVVSAASENNRLCINWMSEYRQDSWISNSALLVNVNTSDFPSTHPLAWIEFQRIWEEKAFNLWWWNYNAPAQLVWDFLAKKPSVSLWSINTTYKPWITLTSLDDCLPDFVSHAIRIALPEFNKKIKWFSTHDSILLWIEARSSSVLTIVRDKDTFQSNIQWIYPCWEWAWYAWWITSSAIDGLIIAERIISNYSDRQ